MSKEGLNKVEYKPVKKKNRLVGKLENFTKAYLFFILFFTAASAGTVFSQKIIESDAMPDNLANNPVAADEKIPAETFSVSSLRPAQKGFYQTDRTDETTSADYSPEEEFRNFLKEKKPPLFQSSNRFRKAETDVSETDQPQTEDKPETQGKDKFHWKPALIQSVTLLGIQHSFRLIQKKTRTELGGPFFRDWGKSVRSLRGWYDGDNVATNYFGHPLQGGATGRIFINNSDRARRQEFGKSKEYWKSRFKAMLWSAVWSTQFELGPISEATIGNVGIRKKKGYSDMAFVDLVITPTVGTGVVVGEDAIDKYILKNWLERKAGRLTTKIKILRSFLTPTTSFTNLLRGKAPWKRNDR